MDGENGGVGRRRVGGSGICEAMPALFRCAEMVLPWLNSSELASLSCSCKFLHLISKPLTANRASDASRSLENHHIPFINTTDHRPYADFVYSPSQIIFPSSSSELERVFWDSRSIVGKSWSRSRGRRNTDCIWGEPSGNVDGACGCDCDDCGEEVVVDGDCLCPCSSFKQSGVVIECGRACRCGSDCSNRPTQRGILVRLKIVRDFRKGWGLYADEKISRGEFICEYAGELLTTKEARRRQHKYDELASMGKYSSTSLLVVREYMPSGRSCIRLNVDATYVGNVARFINHSCDGGNLSFVLVRSLGGFLPRICFFSSRDIQRNEELTFSYGSSELGPSSGTACQCFCGSFCCKGVLPSEDI